MAQQNTVFRLKSCNGFDGLTSTKEDIPKAQPHEVIIKVGSVALNFRDIAIIFSKYPFPVKENVIPCSDAAGEIVEVGSAVAGFSVGDKVVACFNPANLYGPIKDWNNGLGGPVDGVLRNYLPIDGRSVVKIPSSSTLRFSQWASLVCTGVTVWNSLYGNIPLKPGQTVLFQGTGGVSLTGLAIAKAAGARTIITSSSDAKLDYVKSKYGADYTINYKTHPDWSKEVLKLTNGEGVDYILENGGSGTIKQSIDSIRIGGIISAIGFLSSAPQEEMPDVAALALSKGCVIRGITVGSKELLEECVRFVGSHNLDIPVDKTFPFTEEGVVDAYKYVSLGQQMGKVCIDIE